MTRSIDGASAATLLLGLPWFLTSLSVIAMISGIVGMVCGGAVGVALGWLVMLGWLGSGGIVFWEPAEAWFARRVLRCRPPTEQERAHLASAWAEVTARAGVDGTRYSLWIDPSPEMNASAGAGHVVTVTDWALRTQPPARLAAILAHELGHHVGGHAWSSLLVLWYSIPGRVAVTVIREATRFALHMIKVFSALGWLFAVVVLMFFAFGLLMAAPYLLLLLAFPYAAAYAGRAGERRADQFAARLGYGPPLLETLHFLQRIEGAGPREGQLARALATHPPTSERIRALHIFLGRG